MSETPDKMKVADLRSALQDRGLDTKGTKPVLVARLQAALDVENPKDETMEVAADANGEVMEVAEGDAEENEDEEKPAEDGDKAAATPAKTEAAKPAAAEAEKGKKRKAEDEPYEIKENEPEIPEELVCLDWYNSDLNLRIMDDLMTGLPFNRDGWGYCYAGARATHGFTGGKVWYEVKVLENLDVRVEKDASTFDIRIGWSTNDSGLVLGESDSSWCYSSAEGKMVHNTTFEEYGEKFVKNDIIGAFLDLEGDEISMTFTKNGEDQGDAFQIPKEKLAGRALFPHIMSRNIKFELNLGVNKANEDKGQWKEKLEGDFVKVGKVEGDTKVRGTPRIAKREECEMIMMVGLPGSGKTTWVDKHVAENPEKNYNIISTSAMISKMTVKGEARKKVYKGKWDQVVQKSTRSLQELLRTASQRRRNIIIDQTNVFPNAQTRKARPFEGFQRRCVVVVPSDDDYKARCKAQEEAGNKDIPDEAIMEMKANFSLPAEEGSPFQEILFVELARDEAKEVVELYNKVAKEKGFGNAKKTEKNNAKRGRFDRGGRGGAFSPRGMRPMRGELPLRGYIRGVRGNMRGGPSPWNNQGPQNWGGPWNQGGMGMGMGMGMPNSLMGGMGGMGMNQMGGGMGGMGMGGMNGGWGGMGGGMNQMGGMGMGMGGMGGGMGGGWGGGQGMGNMFNRNNMGMSGMNSMGGMGGGRSLMSMGGGGGMTGGLSFGMKKPGFGQGYPGSQKWGGMGGGGGKMGSRGNSRPFRGGRR